MFVRVNELKAVAPRRRRLHLSGIPIATRHHKVMKHTWKSFVVIFILIRPKNFQVPFGMPMHPMPAPVPMPVPVPVPHPVPVPVAQPIPVPQPVPVPVAIHLPPSLVKEHLDRIFKKKTTTTEANYNFAIAFPVPVPMPMAPPLPTPAPVQLPKSPQMPMPPAMQAPILMPSMIMIPSPPLHSIRYRPKGNRHRYYSTDTSKESESNDRIIFPRWFGRQRNHRRFRNSRNVNSDDYNPVPSSSEQNNAEELIKPVLSYISENGKVVFEKPLHKNDAMHLLAEDNKVSSRKVPLTNRVIPLKGPKITVSLKDDKGHKNLALGSSRNKIVFKPLQNRKISNVSLTFQVT